MKLLLTLCVLCGSAFADERTARDPNGRIIGTVTKVTGGEVVRDSAGKIVERRDIRPQADGSKRVTIRDTNGRIIGIEVRR